MPVEITSAPFNPWQELQAYEFIRGAQNGIGACASFTGSMREFNQGDHILAMHIDYYPDMTNKQLVAVVNKKIQKHQLTDALVIHRVGQIKPADTIVLVAAWSAHRKQAFDACREIMEELKHKAPFWKQEITADGSRWVNKNTLG